MHQNHPENLLKYRFLGPIPRESDRRPRDAEAASPRTALYVALVQLITGTTVVIIAQGW